MSTDPNLDLDAILAEFHSRETAPQQPEPAPRRRASFRSPAEPGQTTQQLEAPARPGRHAAPEPEPEPLPPPPVQPAPAPAPRPALRVEIPPRPTEAPRPEPAPERGAPRTRETQKPARKEQPTPRRRGRKGGLFLVLLVLAALLAGLLWWTMREEKQNAPSEPTPVRMSLGEDLEDYLIESSGSSRN